MSQVTAHKPSGLTKIQLKLLHMEMEALNQGLSRTWLTPERLTMALSAILTKQVRIRKIACLLESFGLNLNCSFFSFLL